MSQTDDLRTIFAEALRLSEQAFELKTEFAVMRQVATDRGFDWSQIKALASASVADAEAGDHKRVEKLVSKADFAAAYADMLGLRQDERKHETRSSSQIAVQNRVNLADVARINERALANQAALQSQSVASPSPRSQSDGAAVSNSSAAPSDTAASNSDDVTTVPLKQPEHNRADKRDVDAPRSPTKRPAVHGNPEGENPSAPATLAESVASNSEIEGAAPAGPYLNGRIESDRKTDFSAPSSLLLDDPYNCIPITHQRTPDGGFVTAASQSVSLPGELTAKA